MTINLIFIGRDFYHKSKTTMSFVYLESGLRFDWGKVELALENGDTISIRPATNEELGHYLNKLNQWQKDFDTD